MGKRTILALVVMALVAMGVIAYILVGRGAPPAVVKLLPPADAYLYVNAATVRHASVFGKLPKVEFDPEYAQFVSQTGFDIEKDLDEAAFALEQPAGAGPEAQWHDTGVFSGSFDRAKIEAYLRGVGSGTTTYRGTTIYAIPLPGRTVRVAILDARTVAISNTQGPYVVQAIIDRHAQFTGSTPALVHDYYHQVPWGSVAWAIARPAAPAPGQSPQLELPAGFGLYLPEGTVVVASVRYLGALDLRAQAFAPNAAAAQRITDQLSAFLALFRTLENAQAQGSDQDVKSFFDSIQVTLQGNRAELRAKVPAGFLKKLAANPSPTGAAATSNPPATEPSRKPQPNATRHRPNRKK